MTSACYGDHASPDSATWASWCWMALLPKLRAAPSHRAGRTAVRKAGLDIYRGKSCPLALCISTEDHRRDNIPNSWPGSWKTTRSLSPLLALRCSHSPSSSSTFPTVFVKLISPSTSFILKSSPRQGFASWG